MIKKTICQECHTPNTPGSKFCSNCGARLPKSTSIMCPRCQTPNPSSNFYCDKCGSRLSQEVTPPPAQADDPEDLPTSAKMFSLPTRKPGETGELTADNVMDWLMTSRPAEEEEGPPVETGKLPRLSDLTPEQRESDADLPAWLFDADNPEPIIDAPPDITTAHFLNLIKQIDDDERKKLSGMLSEAMPGQGGSLPDWLQEFVQTGGEETAPEKTTPPPPEPPVSSSEDEGEELDWLAELGPPGSGILSQPVDNTTASQVMTGDLSDLPDWLEELGPPNTAMLARSDREQETPVTPSGLDDKETPDWLEELGPAGTDMLAYPQADEEANVSDEPAETLPAWLVGVRPDTESLAQPREGETPPAESAAEPEPDFPDWLIEPVDTGPLALPYSAEAEDEAAARSLTDWLTDFSEADEESKAIEPEDTVPADWITDEAEETPTAVSAPEAPKPPRTLTDWLTELSTEETEPSAEPEEEDLAAWLTAETPEAEADLFAAEESDDDDAFLAVGMTGPLPDWLDELEPESSDSSEAPEPMVTVAFLDELLGISESAPETPDLPDEPDEVLTAEEEFFASDLPEAEIEAEPDWLSELAAVGAGEMRQETAVAFPDDDELPEPEDEEAPFIYLPESAEAETEIAAAFEAGDDLTEPDEEDWAEVEDILTGKVDTTEFPDWLEQFESSLSETLPQTDSEELESSAIATGELPDWIVNLRPDESDSASGLRPSAAPIPEEIYDLPTDFSSADLPGWLQDAEVSGAELPLLLDDADLPIWVESESELSEPPVELADILADLPATPPLEERLLKAEMPDWLLDLKPPELSGLAPPQLDLKAETTGPLAGILGTVRVEPVVAMPRAVTPLLPYAVTSEQTQQARLLRQLVQEIETPPVSVPTRPDTHGETWVRVGLGLLLLALALLTWFAPGLLLTTSGPAPLSPGAAAAHEAVAAAAGKPVLVVFDYTPALAGELDHAARLLLAELADNGSLILTTSQFAAGTAVANTLTAPYNSQPIGLLAGEAIGLRQLGACLEDNQVACDTLQGRTLSAELQAALQNAGLIILLTGERNSLVNWVEQVGAATETPIVAGVTQALAPVAAPYAATGQLQGVLDGLPAVIAYADAFGTTVNVEQARTQHNAQGLMQLVAAILLLIGAVVFALFRPKAPTRGE